MRSYKDVKKKCLADPEFKKEYEALGPKFDLIEAIVKRRMELKITQKDLAEKLGTGQAVISRIEKGNANPTLASLREIATALDADLHISLEPKHCSKVANV